MGSGGSWSPDEDATYYTPGQRSAGSGGCGGEGDGMWSEAAVKATAGSSFPTVAAVQSSDMPELKKSDTPTLLWPSPSPSLRRVRLPVPPPRLVSSPTARPRASPSAARASPTFPVCSRESPVSSADGARATSASASAVRA